MHHVLVTAPAGSSAATSCAGCGTRASPASAPSTSSRMDEWYQRFDDVENLDADLSSSSTPAGTPPRASTRSSTSPPTWAGWASSRTTRPLCMLSVLDHTHMLVAAREAGVERFFYSSSACVYAAEQADVARGRAAARRPTPTRPCPRTATAGRSCSASGCAATSARTSASRPGSPATTTSTGPTAPATAAGRRRPPPSAARSPPAELTGDHTIEIWGDGEQTRSFTYIDDCLEGTLRITASDVREPLNLGSDELVTINQLVDIVEGIAGVDARAPLQARRPPGRARPQQRQHPASATRWAGRRRSPSRTAWPPPTRGSTTKSRRTSRD